MPRLDRYSVYPHSVKGTVFLTNLFFSLIVIVVLSVAGVPLSAQSPAASSTTTTIQTLAEKGGALTPAAKKGTQISAKSGALPQKGETLKKPNLLQKSTLIKKNLKDTSLEKPSHPKPAVKKSDFNELTKLEIFEIFLRTKEEADLKNDPMRKGDDKIFCKIDADDLEGLKTVVKKQIETKIRTLITERRVYGYRLGQDKMQNFSDERWKTCTMNCTCGVFLELFKQAPPEFLTAEDLKIKDFLMEETNKMDFDALWKCSHELPRYCKGPLVPAMKKAAEALQIAEEAGAKIKEARILQEAAYQEKMKERAKNDEKTKASAETATKEGHQ